MHGAFDCDNTCFLISVCLSLSLSVCFCRRRVSRLPCACRVRFLLLPRESFPTDLDLSSLRVAPSRDDSSDPVTLSLALSLSLSLSFLLSIFLRTYLLLSLRLRRSVTFGAPSAARRRKEGRKEGRMCPLMSFALRSFFSPRPLRPSLSGHPSFWLTSGDVRRASRSVLLSLVDRRAPRKELCLSRRRSNTPCNHTTYDVVRSHTTGRDSFTDIFAALSRTLRFRMVHMGV